MLTNTDAQLIADCHASDAALEAKIAELRAIYHAMKRIAKKA